MADQVPQPAPACGLRTVHRRADAGRAEPEQRLAGVAVVARYEGDGRDSGKLAYEPGHRRELVAAAGVDREDERVHPLDRKSTRLNSSHLVISYAVFCLKKKKKIQ